MKTLKLIDVWCAKIENVVLIFLLSALILLAFFEIPLSSFFPLESVDTLLRHLVLWVGFFGATLATRENRHINIDVISRYLKGRLKLTSAVLTNLFSALICAILTHAAILVIQDAREFGETITIFTQLPTWVLQLIFVIGFGIMTFRFLLRALENLVQLFHLQEVAS
jgi:TRAP-type C4-dicarboxylate transport system permease small subunit